jgi:hypothetical protein
VRSEPAEAASVFRLHRKFDVSVQLAARALHEAHGREPWIAIAVRRGSGECTTWNLQWATGSAPTNVIDRIATRVLQEGRTAGTEAADSWIYDDLRRQLVVVHPGGVDHHSAEGAQCVSASC